MSNSNQTRTEKFNALRALLNKSLPPSVPTSTYLPKKEEGENRIFRDSYGNEISYNDEQMSFIDLVCSGKSCVLLGPAGTGKTTCTKGAISRLLQSSHVPIISDTLSHKYLTANTPGIILTSFTRRAVRNIKRAMDSGMKDNCITIHKLLEYVPVTYEVYDAESDSYKTTMRFEPSRNAGNPLPSSIRTIVIDESSMVSVELYNQLIAACNHEVQIVFIGDIQQLPPVFGSAILGYKMISLPVVELDKVYRQALESPIIKLATQIRKGESINPFADRMILEGDGKVTLHPWKKKLHPDTALLTAAGFFKAAIDSGNYNPEEDQILTPFNKSCGTIELNKHIANHLAKKSGRMVYEVIAGFNKHYFSEGDLVLFDKEDARIVSINRNATYLGKRPQVPSIHLDYWGYNSEGEGNKVIEQDSIEDVDLYLRAAAGEVEDKVNTASHIITVEMIDSGEEISLETSSEINSLLHSYALTVHKAQGSEWERVFLLFHSSHATMLQRELLYTAVTRAKKELYVICEPDTFYKGVINQRIKGTTLAEKAEFFKGKAEAEGSFVLKGGN